MKQIVRKLILAVQEGIAFSQLKAFPQRGDFKDYNGGKLLHDARAALNVALLTLPQGMAYALIAGLDITYGIYGSIIACLIAPFFGSSRFIALGPTNATAIILLAAFVGYDQSTRLEALGFFLVLVGVFLIIGAFLRIASLIQYVSRTVVTGYITAAALYIIFNQWHNVLGFEFSREAQSFYDVIYLTVTELEKTDMASLLLSLTTVFLWALLQWKFPKLPAVALALVLASLMGWGLSYVEGFTDNLVLLSPVTTEDWQFGIPQFNWEWMGAFASPALSVALLCVLEGTAIAKSLAARSGDRVDTNQEMLSIGVANVACGLGSGMAASGSLTRSALNHQAGAATCLSSFLCGLFCLLSVVLLGTFFQYIPQAALAVMVVCVGFSLINRHHIRIALRSTRSDRVVFLLTLLAGLLVKLDFAIYLGVAASVVLFLRKASAPELVEYTFSESGELHQIDDKKERPGGAISIVHAEGDLFFGSAELFRDGMRRVCEDPGLKVIILRMRNARHLDATSVMALEELVTFLRDHDRDLIVSGAMKDVIRVLKNSGLFDFIGRENIFPGSIRNPNLATRNALIRAKEITGEPTSDVRIYYDPKVQQGS